MKERLEEQAGWSEYFVGYDTGNIVGTTEATDIANASRFYDTAGNLTIIMNRDNVLQDTGLPTRTPSRTQAYAIMESILVALKLRNCVPSLRLAAAAPIFFWFCLIC
jgi:hypothetical protein